MRAMIVKARTYEAALQLLCQHPGVDHSSTENLVNAIDLQITLTYSSLNKKNQLIRSIGDKYANKQYFDGY